MLGLYLFTLIISQEICSMLSIRNVLTLHEELQNFMKIMYLWTKISQQKQKRKNANKHPCQSRNSSPGPLAPQSFGDRVS